MIATASSCTLVGIDAEPVEVAVHPVADLGEVVATLRRAEPGEPSAAIRARVVEARERQRARLRPWNLRRNAEMSSAVLRAMCRLDRIGERTLAERVERRRSFTARSIDGLVKAAHTVADLLGQDDIDAGCLLEAAAHREVDSTADLVPQVR